MMTLTLQRLAMAHVQALLKKNYFLNKKSHRDAFRLYIAELRTKTLTNDEVIAKTSLLKNTIYRQGWFGIPGFGCGYALKEIDILLRSALFLKQDEQENSLKTNAIRKLAVLTANDIYTKQTIFTTAKQKNALNRLYDVVLTPNARDEEIIAVAQQEVHQLQRKRWLFWQSNNFFLDRVKIFLEQVMVLRKTDSPPPVKKIPVPHFPQEHLEKITNAKNSQEKINGALQDQIDYEEIDKKREQLENEITEILEQYAYNQPLAARWIFRVNRVANKTLPVNSEQFFEIFKNEIKLFDKQYPETHLAKKMQAYHTLIKDKQYDEYLRHREIKTHQTPAPFKPLQKFRKKETASVKKNSLFEMKVSLSSLNTREKSREEYRENLVTDRSL